MSLRTVAALMIVLGVLMWSVSTHAPSMPAVDHSVIEAIDAGRTTTPIISNGRVTFYAKSTDGDAPRVVSDLTGWGESGNGSFNFNVGRMQRVDATNWYELSAPVVAGARIEYLFAYGAGSYRIDPHNPRKVMRPGGEASEFVTAGYVEPREFRDPVSTPKGSLVFDDYIESPSIPGSASSPAAKRRVIVYVPPGYDSSTPYPFAVFHDGALMVTVGEVPRVLDDLIDRQAIKPIIAVFVEPESRADDYQPGAAMRDFVGSDLVRWLSHQYSVTSDARDHAIIGVSAGASGAMDVMAKYAGIFGKCGLLIPALHDTAVMAVAERPKMPSPLTFSIVAAKYDALYRMSAAHANALLTSAGYDVRYLEVPEGHATATWKTHLSKVLIDLFG